MDEVLRADEFERKSIAHFLALLAPFREAETLDCDLPEADVFRGERQFYDLMRGIYEGMYADPVAYLVPVGAYAAYCKNAVPKAGREKFHTADARESTLRNTFQQAILFYARFFFELGSRMTCIENGRAVLSTAAMEEVYRVMEMTHIRRENAARYEKLAALGFSVTQEGDQAFAVCENRPDLFAGLWVLAKSAGRYRYMNYLRLDYRAAVRGAPEAADILDTLQEPARGIVGAVHEAMEAYGCRMRIKPMRSITSGFRWKVEYLLKGKNVFGFYAGPDDVMLCVYFNDAKNITQMADRLQSEDPALCAWFCTQFPERLCRCPSNRAVMLRGERRRICGLSNRAEVEHAQEADLQRALAVFRLFRGL